MSIKDETVLAGKKTPEVIPVETKTTVTNAQTGYWRSLNERKTKN